MKHEGLASICVIFPKSPDERKRMLEEIGAKSIEDLFLQLS